MHRLEEHCEPAAPALRVEDLSPAEQCAHLCSIAFGDCGMEGGAIESIGPPVGQALPSRQCHAAPGAEAIAINRTGIRLQSIRLKVVCCFLFMVNFLRQLIYSHCSTVAQHHASAKRRIMGSQYPARKRHMRMYFGVGCR